LLLNISCSFRDPMHPAETSFPTHRYTQLHLNSHPLYRSPKLRLICEFDGYELFRPLGYEFNTWFWIDGVIAKNQSHTVSMCLIISTVSGSLVSNLLALFRPAEALDRLRIAAKTDPCRPRSSTFLPTDSLRPTGTVKPPGIARSSGKAGGVSFVGSTVVYAHMQTVGMVNDHLIDYREIRGLDTGNGVSFRIR
jgi:hypothetical protein